MRRPDTRSPDMRGQTPGHAAASLHPTAPLRIHGCGVRIGHEYVPGLTFGIASSILPIRVSHVRIRQPLRCAAGSGVRSWRSAPISRAPAVAIRA